MVIAAGNPTNCLDCHKDKLQPAMHVDHVLSGYVTNDAAAGCVACHNGLDMIIDVHKANCTDCHQDPATGDYSLKIGSPAEGKYVKGYTGCKQLYNLSWRLFFNHTNPTLKHNVANSVTMHAECQQCHPNPQVLLVDPT